MVIARGNEDPFLHTCVGCDARNLHTLAVTIGQGLPFAPLCLTCRQKIPMFAICRPGFETETMHYRLFRVKLGRRGEAVLQTTPSLYLHKQELDVVFPHLSHLFNWVCL